MRISDLEPFKPNSEFFKHFKYTFGSPFTNAKSIKFATQCYSSVNLSVVPKNFSWRLWGQSELESDRKPTQQQQQQKTSLKVGKSSSTDMLPSIAETNDTPTPRPCVCCKRLPKIVNKLKEEGKTIIAYEVFFHYDLY